MSKNEKDFSIKLNKNEIFKNLICISCLITISLVTVQSCTSNYNESTEIDSVHLQTEKSNQINQESQLEDVSTITKSEYLGMTKQRKDDFKKGLCI